MRVVPVPVAFSDKRQIREGVLQALRPSRAAHRLPSVVACLVVVSTHAPSIHGLAKHHLRPRNATDLY